MSEPEQTPAENINKEELTPQKQRQLYKEVGQKTQQVGDTWYPISAKWYKSWIEYTAYNKKDEDIEEGLENLHMRDVPRPGPIDNSELASQDDSLQLKKELEEHLTHVWLHSAHWNLLHSWYGGGPEFPRKVYERGTTYTREKYIAMYPKFLKLAEVNPNGTYDTTKPQIQSFQEHQTLQDVITFLEGGTEDSEAPSVHLWVSFEHIKKIYPVTTKRATVTMDDLKDEDPNRYVEIPDDHLKTSLNDVMLPKDVVLLVEKKIDWSKQTENNNEEEKKFPWPLVKGPEKWKQFQVGDIVDGQDDQRKWYEGYVRYVGKEGTEHAGKLVVHFIGWDSKWDEWISIGEYERLAMRHTHTKGKPYRPQPQKKTTYSSFSSASSSWYGYSHDEGTPEQKGVVGLRNLGNTCFMNSTIQCLAQSPYLTEYFLKGDFIHHINHKNPLGWKGKVAQAWAQLLQDMFSNKYKVIAPREFKTAIGEVAPRFMGYSQQDSQELLSFLLDGLHEDLNQVQEKPATEAVESNGRPDEVVAAEAWRTYLKRNISAIVDLLQGQYKSRVECPDCGRVSITFDPYMFLSVPLPTERYKMLEFTWVGDPNAPPTVYGVKMLKVADVAMLKSAIAKQFKIDKDSLYVCDVWKSKIHHELKGRDMIAEINRRNDDIIVFYAPKPEIPNETISGEDKEKNKNKEKDKSEEAADSDENGTSSKAGASDQKGPLFNVFVVLCQTRIQARGGYHRDEDEQIGMPLLVTFPLDKPVSHKEAIERIFNLVKPYLTDKEKWGLGKDQKLPFTCFATYGFSSVLQLEDKDDPLPLKERHFKFNLHFPDRSEYNEEICLREKRLRHESAPAPLNSSSYLDDEDRASGKPVELGACVDAFTEEEILDENDAWYCSKCSDFKCAKKKMDLWSAPDLLIIHLKRFSYTRQWRDRINTLVKFPLEGLDMSPWIVCDEYKRDAVYDLYGISNHMGGMGGGHYTAYAKNLYNGRWYHLDDSRTSEVRNPDMMISSAAYVLYYKRRKPRELKHRPSKVIIPAIDSIKVTKTPEKSESENPTVDQE
ncbi:ubiquitin carboxyl-terminal hydrolase 11 [Reticulomyxa filosa]|uniref:Ubiquitin carboxyl-terminal hydrolase 11 n=1 Tax=Reticulomyxa filosa TaxID=46433 RepID=X6NK68_RETFI|nr:ubiquitin carboxyl-terminal hydrolase 11 [Reticulomyxa filosa]|eukprot:ETO26124.1 ubiquitin carboxyl-terminal hydrolase 11 [Reticulomyxa filosa]